MITEIIVVPIDNGQSYDILDQNRQLLSDHGTEQHAINEAMNLAATHNVEYVKLQVKPE